MASTGEPAGLRVGMARWDGLSASREQYAQSPGEIADALGETWVSLLVRATGEAVSEAAKEVLTRKSRRHHEAVRELNASRQPQKGTGKRAMALVQHFREVPLV